MSWDLAATLVVGENNAAKASVTGVYIKVLHAYLYSDQVTASDVSRRTITSAPAASRTRHCDADKYRKFATILGLILETEPHKVDICFILGRLGLTPRCGT